LQAKEREDKHRFGEMLRGEMKRRDADSRLAREQGMDDGERDLNRKLMEEIAEKKEKLL